MTVNTTRIISGYHDGSKLVGAINDFLLQYNKDGKWVDIPGSKVTENTAFDADRKFDAISAKQLRLLITKTQDNTVRLWEIEFYRQP